MGAERSWVTNVVGRLAYSVIRKQKNREEGQEKKNNNSRKAGKGAVGEKC